MREPTLNAKSATFLKLILSKFLENANNATPPRPAEGGATPQQISFSIFRISRAPQKIQIREEENVARPAVSFALLWGFGVLPYRAGGGGFWLEGEAD
jgi:hypothetical protein